MPGNPNDRLKAAIGMMGSKSSAGDGEAVAAFRAASRLLEAAGLTWADVAARAFDPSSPADRATSRARGDFSDIFADIFAGGGFKASAPPPQAAHRPKPRPQRVTGAEVPEIVTGIVRVVDADRKARTGPMLVLDVIGDDRIYGPLVCFSQNVQDTLRSTLDEGRSVMVRIQKPRADGHMPVVTSVEVRQNA